jgi:hypothetical protein
VTSSAHSELIGLETRALFFGLGDLVTIANPMIASKNLDTKTPPAYADCASELIFGDLLNIGGVVSLSSDFGSPVAQTRRSDRDGSCFI